MFQIWLTHWGLLVDHKFQSSSVYQNLLAKCLTYHVFTIIFIVQCYNLYFSGYNQCSHFKKCLEGLIFLQYGKENGKIMSTYVLLVKNLFAINIFRVVKGKNIASLISSEMNTASLKVLISIALAVQPGWRKFLYGENDYF